MLLCYLNPRRCKFEWRGPYFCFHFLFRQDSEICITAMNKQLQSKSQTRQGQVGLQYPSGCGSCCFIFPTPESPGKNLQNLVLFWCWVILRHDIEFLPVVCPYVLPLPLFTEPRVDKAWPGSWKKTRELWGLHTCLFSRAAAVAAATASLQRTLIY